jgi:hypothetical protein
MAVIRRLLFRDGNSPPSLAVEILLPQVPAHARGSAERISGCGFVPQVPAHARPLATGSSGVSGTVAVTSNTSPMRISAQVWVFIAPLVSLLFHFLIEPHLDSTMATARPLEMDAVANPTIAALSGLR